MFKVFYRALGALLMLIALVGFNLAIAYSSIPHYQQQGWAEFCGSNAVWLLGVGILTLVYSESHEVAMRQLNWERQRERETQGL